MRKCHKNKKIETRMQALVYEIYGIMQKAGAQKYVKDAPKKIEEMQKEVLKQLHSHAYKSSQSSVPCTVE